MEKVNKILIPTDFSICSNEALSYGVFLARQLKATLLLTHVMESIGYPLSSISSHPFGHAELRAGQELDRLARPWRKSGVPIETHLLKGTPAADIVSVAQQLECDLIVMGTHGRTGIAHALMGSVAESVIRTSPIPVLTVRWREEAASAKEERVAVTISPVTI